MREEIDPKLKNEWEEKLKEHGLPETIRRQKIPMPIDPSLSAREILTGLVYKEHDIEELWKKFETLSEKIRDDILVDIKNKRDTGMPPREILDRLDILIAKGHELEGMTVADSDEIHKPKPSKEEQEQQERDDAINKVVNIFIEKAERKKQEDDSTSQNTKIN